MACRMPELPAYAAAVLRALEDAGFEAWVVGGWVRDALLGSASHDVDVCTSAPWQESERALLAAGLAVHRTGTQHGTVTAVSEGKPVEVTTYRVDGAYSDARHPDSVRFVRDVREDLARRDFTINAMAYHPA
ncbi:MAG: phosphohydrolase, partial [Atopobiaceae bacterium]|nr:phosphohydrolase [Atopobiaceae bacterium]